MIPLVATEKIPSDTTRDRSRDLPTSKGSVLNTTLPLAQVCPGVYSEYGAVRAFETSVPLYQAIWCGIPGNRNLCPFRGVFF
jgi:hypothetical protein